MGTILECCRFDTDNRSLGLCFDVELEDGEITATEQENVHYALPDELKTMEMTPWTEYFVEELF